MQIDVKMYKEWVMTLDIDYYSTSIYEVKKEIYGQKKLPIAD